MMDTSEIVGKTGRFSGDATRSNDTKYGPMSKTPKAIGEKKENGTYPTGGGGGDTVDRRGHAAPHTIVKPKSEYPPTYPKVPPHNNQPSWKNVPIAPSVTISAAGKAVSLTWNINSYMLQLKAKINAYELYVCKETDRTPDPSMWVLISIVKASALPMRCTIELKDGGFTYHFALRAVDEHGRRAPFTVVKTTI